MRVHYTEKLQSFLKMEYMNNGPMGLPNFCPSKNPVFHYPKLRVRKMINIYRAILVFLMLFFAECGPDVKFRIPQPDEKPNLQSIPESYHGTFQSTTDSSLLVVDDLKIYKIWKSNEVIPADTLFKELNFRVQKDTTVNLEGGFTVDVKITDDVSKVIVSAQEKLFEVSDTQIVRQFKNYCFLNYKTKDGYWLVKILRIKKGYLEFSDLVDTKEIDAIDDFTKVIAIKDTASNKNLEYQLNPSRRELKRILRGKVFDKNYKKVN